MAGNRKFPLMGVEAALFDFGNEEVRVDEERLELNYDSGSKRSPLVIEELVTSGCKKLPLAPTLEDFLAEGAEKKYFPRPEWCRRPCIYDDHISSSTEVPIQVENFRVGNREQEEVVEGVINQERQEFITAPENGLLPEQSFWEVSPLRHRSSELYSYTRKILDFLPLPNEETALAFARSPMFQATCRFPKNQGNHSRHTLHSAFHSEEDQNCSTYDSLSVEQQNVNDKSREGGAAPLFGNDRNSALHMAIQASNVSIHPALTLIYLGAETNFPNREGITPIIVASERGQIEIVKSLFYRGANPVTSSRNGTTPLMQASCNGHVEIVSFLLKRGVLPNQTDHRNVTALMKASQRGHEKVVQILSNNGCDLDKVNDNGMSALMLAAESGHTSVVQVLIQAGAKLDIRTKQNMSALMFSCIGGVDRVDTVKALLSKGCEISFEDNQGRTARDIALEKDDNLAEYIDHEVQHILMKQRVYVERMHVFAKLWILLHNGRASFSPLYIGHSKICSMNLIPSRLEIDHSYESRLALVRTMALPFDLVMSIAGFLPLPQLWEKRVEMLSRSYHLSPGTAISCALDLIDDALDEMGFARACDSIGITAPVTFMTWKQWTLFRKVGMMKYVEKAKIKRKSRCLDDWVGRELEALHLRREACFLQILSFRSPLISKCLSSSPYNVPLGILNKLKSASHVATLVKRMGSRSVHFDVSVASEIVQLASELILWLR